MRVHEGAALVIGLVAPGLLPVGVVCADLSRISLLRALSRVGAGIKFWPGPFPPAPPSWAGITCSPSQTGCPLKTLNKARDCLILFP